MLYQSDYVLYLRINQYVRLVLASCLDVNSTNKVTLDVEDPQKTFVVNVLKSLLGILPGVGFFSSYIIKAAKLE